MNNKTEIAFFVIASGLILSIVTLLVSAVGAASVPAMLSVFEFAAKSLVAFFGLALVAAFLADVFAKFGDRS